MAKQKTCKACKSKFMPTQFAQCVCDWKCSIEWERMKKEKKAARDHRAAKKTFRANDRPLQLKLTQAVFNKWIRMRDDKAPCISCGRHHTGQYHAGHYRSVGAMPDLRFSPENVHKQCAPCNNHKSGNITEYRLNLVKKIGAEKVEWLEGPHEAKKWTLEELIVIKQHYLKLCNEFE